MVKEPDEQEPRDARDEPRERRERRPPREPRERRPRDEDSEPRPWGARVLAPVAFFTAVVVLVLLVNNSLSSDTEKSPSAAPAPTTTGGPTTGPTTTVPRAQRRFYRIRTGDTLEAIAARFDTTVDDLLQLNPGIDANALSPGQRIRIK